MKSFITNWWMVAFAPIFLISTNAFAQNAEVRSISGVVYNATDSSSLPGVTIQILPGEQSVKSDDSGRFNIPKGIISPKSLVFHYLGMNTDTVSILSMNHNQLMIYLYPKNNRLQEVKIESAKKSLTMDMLGMHNTQNMDSRELLKAACCNLSQSFETMPSVDVGFTDAVSGYRQIRLLGLAGANTALTRENIPDARGLATVTGLTFTPGTWVESMQLSKGIGSVVNGYEGVAGQINVEWWKPFMKTTPAWYLNVYQDIQGRSEANIIYNHAFNEALSTGLFLNTSQTWRKNDANEDGFLDVPIGKTFVGANRWFWFGKNGLDLQWGVKGVYLDHTGGQRDYDRDKDIGSQNMWGYYQKLKRIESWAKIGKVYKSQPWKSFGLQLSGVYHQQNSRYGLRDYDGKERSLYANFIYQTIISTTDNIIKAGASYNYDRVNEDFIGDDYSYAESVPGIFAEYSYSYLKKFGAVVGLRGDYSNIYGFFATPRIHIRYAPKENTVLRASAGRAQRVASVFAENSGYLASNRQFIIRTNDSKGAYGLKPEIAWNMGLSLLQKFRLNYRDGSFMVDYYYTNFQNKVIADIENPGEVKFYNLDGKSYANSFQAQLDYEPVRRWDVRLAYRYYLIKTNYDEGLKSEPLLSAQRAFLNTGYATGSHWKFDYTLQWNGKKRIPRYMLDGKNISEHYSPDFIQMNLQVSKTWKKKNFEWYAGVENLTNYMQPDIILDAAQPFGKDFDASLVWGPGMGRNIYMGIRWKIK